MLVFDKIERQWKGCSFRPSDAETSELSMLREHRSLERQVASVRSELRRLAKEVEALAKSNKSKRKGKKTSEEETPAEEPTANDGEDDIDEMKKLLNEVIA